MYDCKTTGSVIHGPYLNGKSGQTYDHCQESCESNLSCSSYRVSENLGNRNAPLSCMTFGDLGKSPAGYDLGLKLGADGLGILETHCTRNSSLREVISKASPYPTIRSKYDGSKEKLPIWAKILLAMGSFVFFGALAFAFIRSKRPVTVPVPARIA